MRGYHYTSWENWLKIREEGINPYRITHPGLIPDIGPDVDAIFVWKTRQEGFRHTGQILFHMLNKHTLRAVCLSFEYQPEECLKSGWGPIHVTHDGDFQVGAKGSPITPWVYHDREPATLLIVPVHPDRITLEGVYDLEEMVRLGDQRPWLKEEHARAA